MSNEIKICDVNIEDEMGNKIKIGSAKLQIDVMPENLAFNKEKLIVLQKLDLQFKEGEAIYNNGGFWTNARYDLERGEVFK